MQVPQRLFHRVSRNFFALQSFFFRISQEVV
jgi:hypothetical protein